MGLDEFSEGHLEDNVKEADHVIETFSIEVDVNSEQKTTLYEKQGRPAKKLRTSCLLCHIETSESWTDLSSAEENIEALKTKLKHHLKVNVAQGFICLKCRNKVETIHKKIECLLEKMPSILPKTTEELSKSYPLVQAKRRIVCEYSSKDKTCVVCNRFLGGESRAGSVEFHKEVTNNQSLVVDVLNKIVEDNVEAGLYSLLMCRRCFLLLDRLDEIEKESSKIKAEVNNNFLVSRNELERCFLNDTNLVQDVEGPEHISEKAKNFMLQNLTLNIIDTENEQKDFLMYSSDLETQDFEDEVIMARNLPYMNVFLDAKELSALCPVAMKDSTDKFMVLLLNLCQINPIFSITYDGLLVINSKTVFEQHFKQSSLDLNQTNEPLYTCQNCRKQFRYFHLLIPHLKSHLEPQISKSPTVERPYKCELCDKTFKLNKQLLQHSREIHGRVKLLCPLCPKFFKKNSSLESHIKAIHDSENIVRLRCDQCDKTFSGEHSLRMHLVKHTGEKAWQCGTCGKGFTRKASLAEHIARHKGVKEKKCNYCNKSFYGTAYWRHMASVHPKEEKLVHSCPHCPKKFPHQHRLRLHLQSHLEYNQRQFLCDKCPDKRFSSLDRLKAHIKTVHDEKIPGSHLCVDCGATFSNYSALYAHTKRIHKDGKPRPFQCSQCNKSFTALVALTRHVNTTHVDKPFQCDVINCSKAFKTLNELMMHGEKLHKSKDSTDHMDIAISDCLVEELEESQIVQEDKNDHGNELLEVNKTDEGLIDDVDTGALSHTDMTSLLEQELGTSQVVLLADDNRAKVVNVCTDNDLFDSNTIIITEDQGSKLMEALAAEVTSQTKQFVKDPQSGKEKEVYPCVECDKVYMNERSRSLHIKSVHLQEKPYQCDICDKAFVCASYLNDHRRVHDKIKPYQCSLCDKSFKTSRELTRHFRVHTGEKPFKCNDCGKRFSAPSNLSEHRTLHTGRLPYSCQGCGGKFRLWTTLKKHSVKCEGAKKETTTKEESLVMLEDLGQGEVTHVLVVDAEGDQVNLGELTGDNSVGVVLGEGQYTTMITM